MREYCALIWLSRRMGMVFILWRGVTGSHWKAQVVTGTAVGVGRFTLWIEGEIVDGGVLGTTEGRMWDNLDILVEYGVLDISEVPLRVSQLCPHSWDKVEEWLWAVWGVWGGGTKWLVVIIQALGVEQKSCSTTKWAWTMITVYISWCWLVTSMKKMLLVLLVRVEAIGTEITDEAMSCSCYGNSSRSFGLHDEQ